MSIPAIAPPAEPESALKANAAATIAQAATSAPRAARAPRRRPSLSLISNPLCVWVGLREAPAADRGGKARRCSTRVRERAPEGPRPPGGRAARRRSRRRQPRRGARGHQPSDAVAEPEESAGREVAGKRERQLER